MPFRKSITVSLIPSLNSIIHNSAIVVKCHSPSASVNSANAYNGRVLSNTWLHGA